MTEEKALELEKLHKAIDLIHETQGGLEELEKRVQEEINLGCGKEDKQGNNELYDENFAEELESIAGHVLYLAKYGVEK